MTGWTAQIGKPIVLVGLMGAGKTSIGRRLAARVDLPFKDADAEIEAAAGATIPDIFERLGEPAFRDGERRVIARLLGGPIHILATGGGAFMDESTRTLIKSRAVSVWLRADLETLVQRTGRSSHRPLLRTGDPREILRRLMERRYPVYAQADIVVQSDDRPAERTVDLVSAALTDFFARRGAPAQEVSA